MGPEALARDIKLCGKLLQMDDRNFHCWNYRRFIVGLAKRTARDEVDFTTEKINANFSNYSAWHFRSKLLRELPEGSIEKELSSELEFVRQAFFTEPNDQSGWFYHRWLLGRDTENLPLSLSCATRVGPQLLLSFSEAVQGVSDMSVLVSAEGGTVLGLAWEAYAPKTFGGALSAMVWMAQLPDTHQSAQLSVQATEGDEHVLTLVGQARWASHGPIAVVDMTEPVEATPNLGVTHGDEVEAFEGMGVEVLEGSLQMGGCTGPEVVIITSVPAVLEHVWGGADEESIVLGGTQRFGVWNPGNEERTQWCFSCVTPQLTAEDAGDVGIELPGCTAFNGVLQVHQAQEAPEMTSTQLMLLDEIHAIRELLTLEPDSKWAQLTLARMCRAIGWPRHAIIHYLHKLAAEDMMRQQYYLDMASTWVVQDAIAEAMPCTNLTLAGLQLVTLPPPTKLAAPFLALRVLNLACNALTSTTSLTAPAFPLLEELCLDENRIQVVALRTISTLPRLQKLSIKSNGLKSHQGFAELKASLDVSLNPVVQDGGFAEAILVACPVLLATEQAGVFTTSTS